MVKGISEYSNLRQMPLIQPREFKKIRSDIRMIKERHPIDQVGWYDPQSHVIKVDRDAVGNLSILVRCDPDTLEQVVKIHAVFHEALHSYMGDDYLAVDHRLVEHFIHHMMFYLLIDPRHTQQLLPDLLNSFGGLSENGSCNRAFLAIHELQPEDCRVSDGDFAAYPPTWVIDSMSIVRRYGVKNFAEWDRFVFRNTG